MRAAFYECDVTPPLGCFIWGSYRRVIANDVYDKLYVKAAVFEDAGEIAIVIAIDSCSIPPDLRDAVNARIKEYIGIDADKIVITSNHTHTGAPIMDDPTVDSYADPTYKDVFYRIVADAAILAYKRLDDSEAVFGTSVVSGLSFNRTYLLKDGTMITHGRGRDNIVKPLAGTDDTLSVILVSHSEKPIGAIVNYALHGDTTGKGNSYSGDYSSQISHELKKIYGSDFVSLFVIGACGDINHVNPDVNEKLMNSRQIGTKLAKGALDAINGAKPVGGGVQMIVEEIKVKRRTLEPDEAINAIIKHLDYPNRNMTRARNLMFYQTNNQKTEDELLVGALKIGNVCIHFLPGEIFVNTGMYIKDNSAFVNNIIVENCFTYCGYIPTSDVFNEKSNMYETSLCFDSCYAPETCDIIAGKALELSQKLSDKR